jgi:hypothetical protein
MALSVRRFPRRYRSGDGFALAGEEMLKGGVVDRLTVDKGRGERSSVRRLEERILSSWEM